MGLITVDMAAERLLVSRKTVDRMIRRGVLPAYRIGPKAVRIDEDDLDAYVKGNRVAPVREQQKAAITRPCRYVPGMKVV